LLLGGDQGGHVLLVLSGRVGRSVHRDARFEQEEEEEEEKQNQAC
jgi:hypothetical protein